MLRGGLIFFYQVGRCLWTPQSGGASRQFDPYLFINSLFWCKKVWTLPCLHYYGCDGVSIQSTQLNNLPLCCRNFTTKETSSIWYVIIYVRWMLWYFCIIFLLHMERLEFIVHNSWSDIHGRTCYNCYFYAWNTLIFAYKRWCCWFLEKYWVLDRHSFWTNVSPQWGKQPRWCSQGDTWICIALVKKAFEKQLNCCHYDFKFSCV